MKKILYTMVAFFCVAFALQSCFQDMDHPAFDYPESSGEKEYSPMKMDSIMICVIRVYMVSMCIRKEVRLSVMMPLRGKPIRVLYDSRCSQLSEGYHSQFGEFYGSFLDEVGKEYGGYRSVQFE